MITKKVDVMVVAAHPDDPEFGVAGTVARWTRDGNVVVYVVCTSGDKGTPDVNIKPQELARTREQEQRAAAKLLGVSEVVFLRHLDQELEDTPGLRKEIVRQIRLYRPDIVVAPDPYRRYIWHRDHRIVGQVTLDAIYPYSRDNLAYPDLLEEGIKPHVVKEVWLSASEDPNLRIDITDTFDIKMKALSCHKSQVGETISPELSEQVRERARNAAEGEKFELAEAFHREEILG